MAPCWRKIENAEGFIGYINDDSGFQWDHPKYPEITRLIDECNYIKYPSYRVAAKLRALQQSLHVNDVSLSIIEGVFERHKLGANESTLSLEPCDLEAVLSDIFYASNRTNHTNTDVDFASELVLNFLYNIFDAERKKNIDVSSIKLTLGLLSQCGLKELHKFMFNLCSDHNNCVTRLRLQAFLLKLSKIIVYLNENSNFGQQLVNVSLEHCFTKCPGLVGVNESAFVSWLENTPQIINWLPLLFRIKISEKVIHNVKCSVCKTMPLSGLRYRCMKCTRYIQCQRCFLTGRISHSHKITHRMKELCKEPETNKQVINRVVLKVRALIKCNELNIQHDLGADNIIEMKPLCSKMTDQPSEDLLCNIEPLSTPMAQLQFVIKQLEVQNKELQEMLLSGARNEKELKHYLEEHRLQVAAQISKLKLLKMYIKPLKVETSKPTIYNPMESTPLIPNNGKTKSKFDLFSPITQPSVKTTDVISFTDSLKRTQHSLFTNNLSRGEDWDKFARSYSMGDISTWIGGQAITSTMEKSEENKIKPPVQTDLDEALAKLQQILANNFSLDESLGNLDNFDLKHAVNEVEGMLNSIIDNAECGNETAEKLNDQCKYNIS